MNGQQILNFEAGQGELENWVVGIDQFKIAHVPKIESIFAQGNGAMGMRAAAEEAYFEETRNFFVAGTFNRPQGEFEVPELPNAADLINLHIHINGTRFALDKGKIIAFNQQLNLRDGELSRTIIWQNGGGKIQLKFRRFVSLADRHLFASQVEITPLTNAVEITVQTGVDGEMTNSGVQHFEAGEMRFFEQRYGQLQQTTAASNIAFVHNFAVNYLVDDVPKEAQSDMYIGRRDMHLTSRWAIGQNQTLTIEKFANTFTSRDNDIAADSTNTLKEIALEHIKSAAQNRYETVFAHHQAAWRDFWERHDIIIGSKDSFDQVAIRFALYHIRIMTPLYDDRMGIGAKGYTGEGYKGHSFWDTEIYLLPFWYFAEPAVARSLLTYRHHLLPAARQKAADNGYEGAMYPWETAWIDDGEATPEWGNVDHLTGEREKIWTGFIQQHISADIAYAVWMYYRATADEAFMTEHGYEIIFDTANFWQSRLEWDEAAEQYHINNVIGPDEYKEHIDNNAFTNHMAHWNMRLALKLMGLLPQTHPEVFNQLNAKLQLDQLQLTLKRKLPLFYIPQPNENQLIPQDDTYLTLPDLPELASFKQAANVMTIFKSYSMPQLSGYQVSKQADLIVLLVLLPELFDKDVQLANFLYYESKTLHDSSLSYAMHALLAARLKRPEQAYGFFQNAAHVDLSDNMAQSHGGIHAAAMGGIWQDVVRGFGGLQFGENQIFIEPLMPAAWHHLSFPFVYHGGRFRVDITPTHWELHCSQLPPQTTQLNINGQTHKLAIGQVIHQEL